MSWVEWRSFGMEAQFNPRVAAGEEAATCLSNWSEQSMLRKGELSGPFDLPYGTHRQMRFDMHKGHTEKPIIINFHGGYWRALDKSDVNHHMADIAKSGFGLVNMNYPLCPEISLTEIINCLKDGVTEVLDRLKEARQSQSLILMGHSAGAHIALHLSHHEKLMRRLVGVAALSGIYETELVRELSVNDDVRLNEAEAKRWNCLTHMPAVGPAYYIAVGGDEPSGWIDQSWMLAEALNQRGDSVQFHACGQLNHFEMVDHLADASQPDGAKMHNWLKGLKSNPL